jgi:hypothetical protein
MFNPSRDEARQFLFGTWSKYKKGEPLTPLEGMALDVIALHPEYQPILDDAAHYAERDYLPEFGETNPFLHLNLHLAVAEQLSIDQPPGIRAAYQRLRSKMGDEHAALHAVLECLAETIWQAQRHASAPEGTFYLDCLARR